MLLDLLLDHGNLEEFANPLNYDRADASETGVAFYAALAQETGGPCWRMRLARAHKPQ